MPAFLILFSYEDKYDIERTYVINIRLLLFCRETSQQIFSNVQFPEVRDGAYERRRRLRMKNHICRLLKI